MLCRVTILLALLSFSNFLCGVTVSAEKTNLNLATEYNLSSLPSIGHELARKIVEFRENVGDFKEFDDLKEIEGMDDAKIEDISKEFFIEGVASSDCNC